MAQPVGVGISTHAPLAGRDRPACRSARSGRNFNPRAPCGARRDDVPSSDLLDGISTHAPLAGRDHVAARDVVVAHISTHAPLAGRDEAINKANEIANLFQPTRPLRGATTRWRRWWRTSRNFNPRAPCGARPSFEVRHGEESGFQPTRPLRGATQMAKMVEDEQEFQPTRPLRGATGPLGPSKGAERFQPTRPLRGATLHASNIRP